MPKLNEGVRLSLNVVLDRWLSEVMKGNGFSPTPGIFTIEPDMPTRYHQGDVVSFTAKAHIDGGETNCLRFCVVSGED